MTKSVIVKLLNSDVRYAGIKAMRERQQNCITLDELALEASRLLFRCVPFTIEEQVPVFMELGANFGKNNTKSPKKNYLNKRKL
jgi:hypothetical protein